MEQPNRPVPVHNLRPNDMVWTPPAVAFWDTETTWAVEGDLEVHRLRCWVAKVVDRDGKRHRRGGGELDSGTTAAELAQWLDRATVGRPTLWVFAHNAGFDMAVTSLPMIMADLGWAVSDFTVRGGSPWLRLTHGRKTITMVDSWTWLRAPLASVGGMVDYAKPDLPDQADDASEWLTRCSGDVEITARAVIELMDWWDRHRLGRWSITGAACGWNAMRHRPNPHTVVIDPDAQGVTFDRQGVFGGRRDAQVFGVAAGGPFAELDFQAAYPTIAAHLPLPCFRVGVFEGVHADRAMNLEGDYGRMAEVTVTTDVPRYPVRHGGVTWYPVGTFRTTLCGPELDQAVSEGLISEVHKVGLHRLSLHMQPWAEWVISVQDGTAPDTPRVASLAAKSWSRSVIGKWAAHSHSSTKLGPAPTAGWSIIEGWDETAGRPGAIIDMAGQSWSVAYDLEPDNAYPAVLAFVEAHTRYRLSSILASLEGSWVSANTDGVFCDLSQVAPNGYVRRIRGLRPHGDPAAVSDRLAANLGGITWPLRPRTKQIVGSMDVWGPQHVVVGEERRFSGVARSALPGPAGTFVARDWPGLAWQIQHGPAGGYGRPEHRVTINRPLVHRWVCDDGSTVPVEMAVSPDGRNRIVRWSDRGPSYAPLVLYSDQYDRLADMR